MKLDKKTIPNHKYTVTFGVKQTEKISKICNEENITPITFIKKNLNENIDNILNLNKILEKK